MTLAEVIAAELEKARNNLRAAQEGEARAPDDPEWSDLADAARERLAAVQRIADAQAAT